MIQKIDLKYYKDGLVQLMCPMTNNCTYVGTNGIKFHSEDGIMIQNDYLSHPKRNLFPFSEQPTHEDEHGSFSNQLFELEQPYLFIYCDFETPEFLERYFSLKNEEVYLQTEELSMGTKTKEKLDKETLLEKLMQLARESKFLFFLDFDGSITSIGGQEVEVDIPLSGILVYGKGSNVEAFVYQMASEENQITIEMSKVEHSKFKDDTLQAETFTIEPDIHGYKK